MVRLMKLTIRLMCENDLEPLYTLLSNPDIMRFLEPPFSFEQTKHFLNYAGLSPEPLIYAVDDENDRFTGYVIYHDYDEKSKEIGWVLNPDVWGGGYASELTSQLIQKAEDERKNIIIECCPEQNATKAIAKKFGFSYTGTKDGLEIYLKERTGT